MIIHSFNVLFIDLSEVLLKVEDAKIVDFTEYPRLAKVSGNHLLISR